MKVVFTTRGARRARIVDNWWRDHRSAAPELFREELELAKGRMMESPHVGRPYKRLQGRLFRKLLLKGCQQWLFYRVVEDDELIVIHSVWGSRRGEEPELD